MQFCQSLFASALVPLARCWRGIITPRYCKAAHNCYQMASPDRMEVDDNSSDGESSGEENPEEMSDKKAWLAWARALTWDASVADDRDCFSVDALPDDDDRRNTEELMADLRRLPEEPRRHREVGLPGRCVIIARGDLHWRPGRHGRREHRPRARSGAPGEPGRRRPVGPRRRLGPGLSRCVSFEF